MKAAYLIIAHGSRDAQANRDFNAFLEHFRSAYPERKTYGAFLELAQPSIPEALENCVAGGALEIFVIPLMLFSGRHVKEHIPEMIQAAKARHPEIDFHYASPLAEHPMLLSLVEEKARALALKGRSGS